MRVNELRKYLDNFPDNASVVVGGWFARGPVNYRIHPPCNEPMIRDDKRNPGEKVAFVGFFDDCIAHRVETA